VLKIRRCARDADHQPCWLTAEEGLCGREERVEEEGGDLVHGKHLLGRRVGVDDDTVNGGVRLGRVLDDRSRGDGG
jgi:hypothetical protein